MSPISPSDSNMALLHMEQQDLVQKRLAMDGLRERLNGRPDKQAKLREACEGFETVFIQKMWEQMRKNVQQSSYLHSRDEHMYQAMYDGEFAKKMSQAGGIGLADMLYDQLSQRLGESSRTTSTRNDPRLPIIPAASSVGGIDSPIKPLYGEADSAGIQLRKNNIRPLYEDAPPARTAPEEPAAPAADNPEQAAPKSAAPELAAYDEDMELEEFSQTMLTKELSGSEEPEATRREAPTVPTGREVSMNSADEAMIEAALRQNMAEAGRITAAQAPAPGPRSAFGTPLATDTANPADYAAVSITNNMPRS